MSIRLRLTLLYTLILALTLTVFSVGLYVIQERLALNTLQNALAEDARRVADPFDMRGGPSSGGDSRGGRFAVIPRDRLGTSQSYVQVAGMDGTISARSDNLGTASLPLSQTALDAAKRGRASFESATVEGQGLAVYTAPVVGPGRQGAIVQVARGLTDIEALQAGLRRLLIVGTVIASLLAFGIGWLLAGTALRPINRITQTAAAIGAERDFDRRVAYSGPNDELGRLATTFNSMLAGLQEAYHGMAHALEAQRRFVADASHEMRTPLTTIRGNLGLLERQPPISADDEKAVVTDLVDETDRLSRLVNDLLVLARADAGQLVQTEPVCVRPLLEGLCRQAQLLAPQHTIVGGQFPDVAVQANADNLKQVLLILLDNARKFTPPGGAITIAAAANARQVSISVADTGVGIAPDALPHIFTRFYRTDVSRTGPSAGLGLAIAKAIVDAYHGDISVQSAPGQGSTFTVHLPRVALPTALPSAN
ncbi:MAG: HAMP domain-containing sensor histidine kinase [Anaerolineae bacterium]